MRVQIFCVGWSRTRDFSKLNPGAVSGLLRQCALLPISRRRLTFTGTSRPNQLGRPIDASWNCLCGQHGARARLTRGVARRLRDALLISRYWDVSLICEWCLAPEAVIVAASAAISTKRQ